ncbi:MAG TPA: 2'-5' RNA ligase family protein [candidate division Zixibacteria bacterium]|nr:2'-5' RNA ligase family protein [candidate division Zixibacteria bacterium]
MSDCLPLQYALVGYVRNALGEFVENLRRAVHPEHAHLPAHVSVLPPRPLIGVESNALEMLETFCSRVDPFEIEMGDVETFVPTTPTVFIRVAHAGYRLRELHDLLNRDGLQFQEPLPYMPHLTIAKVSTVERAREVFEISRERWAEYKGPRRFKLEEVSFVRGRDHQWSDLSSVSLGKVHK